MKENRIKSYALLIGCFFILLSLINSAWGFVEIPKLSSRVTDLTGTLSESQVRELETKLAAFELKNGSQIAVLIVPTTQPEDIASFGIKVFDLWQLGRKGVDDGLVLIVAKNDRQLRLEVGYGLEGVIPDAVAKRIGSETIAPYFKNSDYAGGINAGIDQIIALIDGEALPVPLSQQPNAQVDENSFIILLFGGLFAGSMLSSLFGRVTGGLMAGIGSGMVGALFMGFGVGAIIIGIIIFFLTSARSSGGGGWSNGGGGFGGYYGGGGSWSGGSSGGSWSGGGGSAGGGGASSSW